MEVDKCTPNNAIVGDLGWKPPCVKQWTSVFRHWARCSVINQYRINFQKFTNGPYESVIPELRIGILE